MKKFTLISFVILLLSLSIFAEPIAISTLIEKAIEVAPSLKSAELTIEDAEIELKRALYNEASLSKNVLASKKDAVDIAIAALKEAEVLVAEETTKLALQSIKARNTLRQNQIALSQAERDLEIAVVKFDRGTISMNELMTAEDKVVAASDAYSSAVDAFLLANEKLAVKIGTDPDTELEVDTKFEPLSLDPILEEITIATKKTDASYLQALQNVTTIKKELDQMIADNEALLSIRQKEIALEKAQLDLSSKEATVISNARSTYTSYLASKKSFENACLEVLRQQKRLEQAKKQYSDGLITLNSVTDIEYQVEIAEMKEIESKWDLHISSLALQRLLDAEGTGL